MVQFISEPQAINEHYGGVHGIEVMNEDVDKQG
jgi:hypothetical protein